MDDKALNQVPRLKRLGSIITEYRGKEDYNKTNQKAKVMFNNEMQLLCTNNLSLEMKM
jgi:hypothetical protein